MATLVKMTKRFLGLSNDLFGFIFCKVPVFKTPNVCAFELDFFDAAADVGVRVPDVLRALTGEAVVPAAEADDAGVWALLLGVGAAVVGPTVVISAAGMAKAGDGRGWSGGKGSARGSQEGGLGGCGKRTACEKSCTREGVSEAESCVRGFGWSVCTG